ncbi:MAG: mechanosensitive ion channel family protein [Nitrospirae bacterium]|nr:mechanosensitive ion channel family protein [Nitrospirota bacterium]
MDVKLVLIPLTTAVLSSVILLIVRAVAFRVLHKWADRTETRADDIIIGAFKSPSIFWCIAIGLYIGIAVSDLPEKYVFQISKAIHIIVIFSITIATANLSGKILRDYIRKTELPIPATGLAFGILKGTILILGLLIILSVLGISITPLITALGVGGLAVALALQDTLANLFAGIHILMEKAVRVGDFIRLETGQEGYVEDITWRTTRIRMMPNNMVVIPNSKLSQSILTNYSLPEKKMALMIPVSVSYGSDPEDVEKILTDEVNKAFGMVDGLLADPPVARLIPGFGKDSLDFTLICHVREFGDQADVQHELRKRIFRRFKEEGIEIPFAQRVVYLREDQDWKK